jgi:hypothetical protein
MSEGADSARPSGASDAGEDPRAVERRVFRDTCIAVVIAVAASAMLAPWRVTTGLLLGGLLSLFNMYWLRTSVSAVFDAAGFDSAGFCCSFFFPSPAETLRPACASESDAKAKTTATARVRRMCFGSCVRR